MNNLPLDGIPTESLLLSGFSIWSLLASIIFGLLGWSVYRKGRRESQVHLAVIGILMMIYPYFTDTAKANWGIGIALTGLVYYSWNKDSLF